MWPFKKKEILDLSDKKEEIVEVSDSASVGDSGVLELGKSGANSSEGNLGFLSSLSNAAESNKIPSELNDKLDAMSNRIYKLIERIELLERKIERLERR